jgi:16S rRNA (cytosine1402-N4)-methyltransferase
MELMVSSVQTQGFGAAAWSFGRLPRLAQYGVRYDFSAPDDLMHQPVMVSESTEMLGVHPGGVYIDGTLGEGGHSLRLLELSRPNGVVLGIDRDPRSLAVARKRLEEHGSRIIFAHGSYADMQRIAAELGIDAVDGVLLDLGFSSRQVDGPGYGLSFQRDEPLDMRYDTSGESAADIVNNADQESLADLIYRYGEERRSRAIARAIINNRPLYTTGQLANVVARAVGGLRRGRHPATRTFQALRIAANRELEHLERGLASVPGLLVSGGRCVIISYHSLEDRIVKGWADVESATCICPPGFPVCVCDHEPTLRMVRRRVVRPSADEITGNPRSRSARLRVVERI